MSAAATGGAGRWRFSGQNLGLIMIALSLLVLALLVMLYSAEERDNRAQAIRAQGLSVSRVLGGMNTDQLAPDSGNVGLLEIVGPSLKGQDFAYVAVVTPDGRVLRQVTNDGVIVPGAPLNLPAAQWFGERQLRDPAANKTLIEFHAPMIGEDGELGGFVRLAYYDPSLGLTGQQLRFVATMILPVFLLVPLFYFPLQRQLRSITEANQSIRHAMDQGDFRM